MKPSDLAGFGRPGVVDPDGAAGTAGAGQNGDVVLVADAEGPTNGPSTGDPRVDAAMARLDQLDRTPVSGHVEVYDAVHRSLQDTLAAIDGT